MGDASDRIFFPGNENATRDEWQVALQVIVFIPLGTISGSARQAQAHAGIVLDEVFALHRYYTTSTTRHK